MSVSYLRPLSHHLVECSFDEHAGRLLAYVNDRVPAADWHRAEDLVQDIWVEVLLAGVDVEDVGAPAVEGLPCWLARAARTVIRRHVSPALAAEVDWAMLTQILGHHASWPERWHDVLAAEGQAALLQLAARDLASDRERQKLAPAA